ncbi:hypothetical protein [Acinetobacter baumannii]|uniref:hypothetical protein n=1 Tax=Acinetobacter baumannii TaxID=470 RepID=UPI003CFF3554
MDNYKIKVKDEAESKEAQELLKQLGFKEEGITDIDLPYYLATWDGGYADYYIDSLSEGKKREEITLPQLRDLVVLKRNDVKDATHRDKQQNSIYLTSDKVIYYWQGEWCKSAINKSNDYENYIANSLTPITQPQDPALISGADAIDALKAKKEVEYCGEGINDSWLSAETLPIIYFLNDSFKFRLKPQTIKLELELPKPFDPKEGETFYYLNDGEECGFIKCEHDWTFDPKELNFGAYRTEEEIKQVVAQLRKIRGAS